MASPEESTGSDREKHDLIKNNTEYLINTYSYKTIQKMASHRKLSANLRVSQGILFLASYGNSRNVV